MHLIPRLRPALAAGRKAGRRGGPKAFSSETPGWQNQITSTSQPKTGTSAYDAALALYNKGQFDTAHSQFADFLRQHPSSSLAPNAMYWQGECLYSQGKFDSAILVFKDLAAKYPKHPKTAAALLKACTKGRGIFH